MCFLVCLQSLELVSIGLSVGLWLQFFLILEYSWSEMMTYEEVAKIEPARDKHRPVIIIGTLLSQTLRFGSCPAVHPSACLFVLTVLLL